MIQKKSPAQKAGLDHSSRLNLTLAGCSSAEPASVSVQQCKIQFSNLYLQPVKILSHLPNILRTRACGLCIENDRLLLVNHLGLSSGDFWAPPGGGMQFGEAATDCVEREFLEETGLVVEVRDFLFTCEFIREPFHAIELFFLVEKVGGQLFKGVDPESGVNQIIKDVKFMDWREIEHLNKGNLHGIFGITQKMERIIDLKGYFKL